MNNRGDIGDLFTIGVILFAVAITTIIAYTLYTNVEARFEELNVTNATDPIFASAESGFNAMDGLFAFTFVGLSIAVVLGAFMIQSHPAFFVFAVFLLMFVILIGIIFSDVYQTTGETEELQDAANRFPMMWFVMNNLGIMLAAVGFITIIVLFSKSYGGGREYG